MSAPRRKSQNRLFDLSCTSHTRATDALSVGNELADLLASPLLAAYPTLDGGGVYISFRGKTLLGGVKNDAQFVFKIGPSKNLRPSRPLRSRLKPLPSRAVIPLFGVRSF